MLRLEIPLSAKSDYDDLHQVLGRTLSTSTKKRQPSIPHSCDTAQELGTGNCSETERESVSDATGCFSPGDL